MLAFEKDFLVLFGWDDFFKSQHPRPESSSFLPARIICEERNLYRVQYGLNTAAWAAISGKMQYAALSRSDYPAVGDWVYVEFPDPAERGIIHSICPRRSIIQRKQIDSSVDMQIMATNVDYVFITTSVNEDLNYRRIDRYLTVVNESSARPIILLTKADVSEKNIGDVVTEMKNEFPGVQIHYLSRDEFDKADFLKEYLAKGKTSLFIGSSGVGKSTLVNFLIGDLQIKTQEIRKYDGKGRHTTTSRNLYVSRYGGLIIDTPGMRELHLSEHVEGVEVQFADVEALFLKCRFSDCQHLTEPGCAIKEAFKSGELSKDRWQSYQKLKDEVASSLLKKNRAMNTNARQDYKKK